MGRIIDVLIATGSVFGAQYAGRELSPTDNRSVRRWYTKLEKPAVTPPAPVFAVVWTVLDGLLAYSGYKLLRAEKSSARTVALCFWALCVAGVAGFPFVLFRAQAGCESRIVYQSDHGFRWCHFVRGEGQ